jgi:hypothetical protein
MKLGAKRQRILSHLRVTLTAPPWKHNRLLLGRLLLVAEYERTPTRCVAIAVQAFHIRLKDLSRLLS